MDHAAAVDRRRRYCLFFSLLVYVDSVLSRFGKLRLREAGPGADLDQLRDQGEFVFQGVVLGPYQRVVQQDLLQVGGGCMAIRRPVPAARPSVPAV